MAIKIGSLGSAECRGLADWMVGIITATGEMQATKSEWPDRGALLRALAHNEVDVAPEYAGGLLAHLRDSQPPTVTGTISELTQVLDPLGIRVIGPSPARDVRALVMRTQVANRFGVRSVAGAALHGRKLRVGGPGWSGTRVWKELGLAAAPAVAQYRQFDDGPLVRRALDRNEIDVAFGFSSDPQFASSDYAVFTAESGTPSIHDNIIMLVRDGMQELVIIDALHAELGVLTTADLAKMT